MGYIFCELYSKTWFAKAFFVILGLSIHVHGMVNCSVIFDEINFMIEINIVKSAKFTAHEIHV